MRAEAVFYLDTEGSTCLTIHVEFFCPESRLASPPPRSSFLHSCSFVLSGLRRARPEFRIMLKHCRKVNNVDVRGRGMDGYRFSPPMVLHRPLVAPPTCLTLFARPTTHVQVIAKGNDWRSMKDVEWRCVGLRGWFGLFGWHMHA